MSELAKRSDVARKAPAKKAAKTAPVKKAPAKKAPAKKAPAKKAPAKKAAAKAAAKKAPAKKAPAKKAASKKSGPKHSRTDTPPPPKSSADGPTMAVRALPAPSEDPMVILGLTEPFSPAQLRRAWRNYATRHHPDQGGDALTFDRGRHAFEALRTAGW